jgi:S1-C subfamily serine protease
MKNITIKSIREKQKDVSKAAENFFQKSRNEIKDAEESYKPTKSKKIIKFIFLTTFIFIIGGIGGVTIDRLALPYLLVKYPSLNQYEFLKKVNERTTTVEIVKEIKISSDEAVSEAVKKVSPSVVQILESEGDKNGGYARKSSGIILTSDGFIITAGKNIVQDEISFEGNGDEAEVMNVKLRDGKTYSAKLISEDLSTGLAIIKIDQENLPVIALANPESLELGERLVVVNSAVATDIISEFIDDYVFSEGEKNPSENKAESAAQKRIKIMNELESSFAGSAVINLKGEIVGLSQGGDLVIPVSEMNRFIEETMNK